MTTFAFLLDMGRCIGCQGCVAACKTGNELPTSVQYIQISDETHGTFPDLTSYVTNHRCYHCADAACVNVCPTGRTLQRRWHDPSGTGEVQRL